MVGAVTNHLLWFGTTVAQRCTQVPKPQGGTAAVALATHLCQSAEGQGEAVAPWGGAEGETLGEGNPKRNLCR